MQFHLDGVRVGDPRVATAAGAPSDFRRLPETVDVLVVGAGPAGLALSAQLSQFAAIRTRLVERRPGPLELGQADGVSRRSLEMFEAFGFSGRVLEEACWIGETTFWEPDAGDPSRIVRRNRIADRDPQLSEFPHVIVNQARVHDAFLEVMRNAPTRLEPSYGWEVTGLEIRHGESHPVAVALRSDGGEATRVRARYVVGCDGAHSTVRRAIGRQLVGDATDQAWGVMDVLAVTDFPDVRVRSLIQSTGGNLIVIPREGGYLVRLYVELDDEAAREAEARGSEALAAAVGRALHPYRFDVKSTAWWSVYRVGQRLCDRFDDATGSQPPHVFIAGDACHTHSAKAGQGMNVSMQDAFNLGWKLAAVLECRSPAAVLATYTAERQAEAQALIDFDREWSATLAAPAAEVPSEQLQALFSRRRRFAAGVGTHYDGPSPVCGRPTHQSLAAGFVIGERFHSAPVVRLADARPLQLGHVAQADGRWRLYAFADAALSRLLALCRHLADDPASPLRRYTPPGADPDSVLDVRAMFQQEREAIAPADLPGLLLPRKGSLGLVDYEKAFVADPTGASDIFALRGIDRARGCLVVVRPDQYIAHVLPLDARDELATFFDGCLSPPR